MIHLLVKLFIQKKEDQASIRQSYGILCGIVGIVLNLLLFLGKFLAGTLSNSIAIVADAINNLSDAGSSLVLLIGFKLAGQKPDAEHPFGHGRIEYVSGLIVAAVILLMAYELIRDSIQKILHPEKMTFTVLTLVILLVSILVKCYMGFYNRSIGIKIDSAAMRATATDSFGDMIATAVVLVSALVGHFTGLAIDGWCGAAVGLFILYAGIMAAKETLNPLLGQKPEKEFVENITDIVLSHEAVRGIHDLIVHDYGPGQRIISLHAEVSAEESITVVHEVIDHIENDLRKELGCEATIHMDPIVTMDQHVIELRKVVESVLVEMDPVLTMHDFRLVPGSKHTNLLFDVVVPFEFSMDDEELVMQIKEQIGERLGGEYSVMVHVDKS